VLESSSQFTLRYLGGATVHSGLFTGNANAMLIACIHVLLSIHSLTCAVTRKALKMVKDLGYSDNAYKRALEKLEKKFGGE
jgi:hypothetical protein